MGARRLHLSAGEEAVVGLRLVVRKRMRVRSRAVADAKLGVSNRTEAVAVALRKQLLKI